ncbi:MAG: MiaB/RimO family radical SAM methylthiotransferase [Anaerolineaceae bacterium]|nr:MiaB/RimO family radical SAM methylthiotransferase [Anaerolineaceae bacterium]
MQKVFFDMVGCRLNQAEIEQLAAAFHEKGYEVVSEAVNADYVIINTCCVTRKAGADSRKMVRHYQAQTSAKLIATGCWVTLFRKGALESLPDVEIIPNLKKEFIPEILRSRNKTPSPCTDARSENKAVLGVRERTRAFVKVQDGCDNHCSYCATTLARGKSRSAPEQAVLQNLKRLEADGIKEVVLSGVQLGSWGNEIGLELADLLSAILEKTNDFRIRLSSIEPWDISAKLIDLWANPRLMPHLHIPLQSGADAILQAMKRPICTQQFRDLLILIRKRVPEMAISTDMIAGFPGETEALFEESLAFAESCHFSRGHVFQFSAMEHTIAAAMPLQVDSSVKKARSKTLLDAFKKAQIGYNQEQIGKVIAVLFESRRGAYASGLSPDYQRVLVPSSEGLRNQIRLVRLKELNGEKVFYGQLIQAEVA